MKRWFIEFYRTRYSLEFEQVQDYYFITQTKR